MTNDVVTPSSSCDEIKRGDVITTKFVVMEKEESSEDSGCVIGSAKNNESASPSASAKSAEEQGKRCV